jgi:hypothetical protein
VLFEQFEKLDAFLVFAFWKTKQLVKRQYAAANLEGW